MRYVIQIAEEYNDEKIGQAKVGSQSHAYIWKDPEKEEMDDRIEELEEKEDDEYNPKEVAYQVAFKNSKGDISIFSANNEDEVLGKIECLNGGGMISYRYDEMYGTLIPEDKFEDVDIANEVVEFTGEGLIFKEEKESGEIDLAS
jgi:hypothetical protein